MTAFLIAAALLAVAGVIRWALLRAFGSARATTGQPTPEQARIVVQGKEAASAIDAAAAAEKEKVNNATDDDVRTGFLAWMRRKK